MVFADLLVRGSLWPLSEYGIANPEWWRALEHAAWVIFEDLVLYVRCLRGLREMSALSVQSSTLEFAKMDVDEQVAERTAELKATGENYRALIENTSAIPWELNRDTCEILYVAPQIRTLFGISLEPGSGRTLLDFLHLEDREPFRRFIQKAAAGGLGGMNHLDSRILKGENQVAYIRSFVADRGDRTGTPSIWGISLDVTQQRRLEVDLAQAQKLESVGQLSAGIAHEINTPTQFIGDNIRFLQESVGEILRVINELIPPADRSADHVLPAAQVAALLAATDMSYLLEEVPKAILQSLDGVERISRIVGAMKEFSHPAIDRTPHDLNRAIASTIIVASNEWKYVPVVNTDFDPDLPMVPVMPGAFNQVILNILVNAAHAVAACATETPQAKGTITVTTRKVGDWAEVRISDTGCGMQERIRERIFDPFFTTKPVGKGTGQGLAIAHDVIVKKHNGTISVESKPGDGTTFILRLPLEADAESPAAAA